MAFDKRDSVEPVGEHVRDVVIVNNTGVQLKRIVGGSILGVMTEEVVQVLEILRGLYPDQELRIILSRITTATVILG